MDEVSESDVLLTYCQNLRDRADDSLFTPTTMYRKSARCKDILQQLRAALRRDFTQDQETTQHLTKHCLVTKDLIPILITYKEDLMDIMMRLTFKLSPLCDKAEQHERLLLDVKLAFLRHGVVTVIMAFFIGPLSKVPTERSMSDKRDLITLVTLLQNILAIRPYRDSRDRHEDLVRVYHEENVFNVFMALSQYVDDKAMLEGGLAVRLVHSIYHTFHGHDAEYMVSSTMARRKRLSEVGGVSVPYDRNALASSTDSELLINGVPSPSLGRKAVPPTTPVTTGSSKLDEHHTPVASGKGLSRLARLRAAEQQSKRTYGARHSRFVDAYVRTTQPVVGGESRSSLVDAHGRELVTEATTTKRSRKVAKSSEQMVLSTPEGLDVLCQVGLSWLSTSSLNVLSEGIRHLLSQSSAEREKNQAITPGDESIHLWVLGFFADLYHQLHVHGALDTVTPASISCVLRADVVRRLSVLIVDAEEQKDHMGLDLYVTVWQRLYGVVRRLYCDNGEPNDADTDRVLRALIMVAVYQPRTLLLPVKHLISAYSSARNSFRFLKTLMRLIHDVLFTTEALCESMSVPLMVQTSHQEAEDMGSMGGTDDDVSSRRTHENAWSSSRVVALFSRITIMENYHHVLADQERNSERDVLAAVDMPWRIAVDLDEPAILWKAPWLLLFHRLMHTVDPATGTGAAAVHRLAERVTQGFMEALAVEPVVGVASLFSSVQSDLAMFRSVVWEDEDDADQGRVEDARRSRKAKAPRGAKGAAAGGGGEGDHEASSDEHQDDSTADTESEDADYDPTRRLYFDQDDDEAVVGSGDEGASPERRARDGDSRKRKGHQRLDPRQAKARRQQQRREKRLQRQQASEARAQRKREKQEQKQREMDEVNAVVERLQQVQVESLTLSRVWTKEEDDDLMAAWQQYSNKPIPRIPAFVFAVCGVNATSYQLMERLLWLRVITRQMFSSMGPFMDGEEEATPLPEDVVGVPPPDPVLEDRRRQRMIGLSSSSPGKQKKKQKQKGKKSTPKSRKRSRLNRRAQVDEEEDDLALSALDDDVDLLGDADSDDERLMSIRGERAARALRKKKQRAAERAAAKQRPATRPTNMSIVTWLAGDDDGRRILTWLMAHLRQSCDASRASNDDADDADSVGDDDDGDVNTRPLSLSIGVKDRNADDNADDDADDGDDATGGEIISVEASVWENADVRRLLRTYPAFFVRVQQQGTDEAVHEGTAPTTPTPTTPTQSSASIPSPTVAPMEDEDASSEPQAANESAVASSNEEGVAATDTGESLATTTSGKAKKQKKAWHVRVRFGGDALTQVGVLLSRMEDALDTTSKSQQRRQRSGRKSRKVSASPVKRTKQPKQSQALLSDDDLDFVFEDAPDADVAATTTAATPVVRAKVRRTILDSDEEDTED